MSIRFPTKDDFDKLRFAIWSIFEILLMVLAMAAVVVGMEAHSMTDVQQEF
jgi:hypothetical protein